MTDFGGLPDLASAKVGGRVVAVNDEFFAPASNLLKPEAPVSRPGEYTERGKWMDGWETRRRREQGHDWCVVRLGLAGVLRGVVVDTTHFEGNYPDAFWLEGCFLAEQEGDPDTWRWFEVSPRSRLTGNAPNRFETGATPVVSHLRFHIEPDGGVARLRVHGHPVPDWAALDHQAYDVAGYRVGGAVVDCSDWFFSAPGALLYPGEPEGMWDGWETRRRRGQGHDWVVVRLGAPALVSKLVVDTSYFRGNAPGWCSVEAAAASEEEEVPWVEILGSTSVRPDEVNEFALERPAGPFSHVRLNIHPDGGVARFRVLGTLEPAEMERRSLHRLNLLPREAAEHELLTCCGSPAWAAAVAGSRPISSLEDLIAISEREWFSLPPEEWERAADTHPRIGEGVGAFARAGRFRLWSAREQAGVGEVTSEVSRRLWEGQQAYEHQFGHRYIVFATGKDAPEILGDLEARLSQDRDAERETTARELAKITNLRVRRLLGLDAQP